ncbi:MAG: hypothetical protein N2Z74_01985 [Syntrophales bacterium]|nr:hypothetical protein [Syntrophales bacterium]
MEKTPEDVLKQEILREKAEVLGRAGTSVEKAIAKLAYLEERIKEKHQQLASLGEKAAEYSPHALAEMRSRIVQALNRDIQRFNRQQEYAQLRYYYLIVTREALGLRRHHKVEEMYRIPPKKRGVGEV